MWEYKVEQATIANRWSQKAQVEEIESFRRTLNRFGREGWELIQYSAVPITGAFSDKVKGYAHFLLFKRELAQ